MIRLLKFLITGDWHLHKWKAVEEYEKFRSRDMAMTGKVYILECEHCGNRKQFTSGV